MSFVDNADRITSKDTLKLLISTHNKQGKRPKIPESIFSKIDDASSTTADAWLKAHDDSEEKDKGKTLFQIAIEKKIVDIYSRDIEDLIGGHYYIPPDQPLLVLPVETYAPLLEEEDLAGVWKGIIKHKACAVKTITGAAALALEWKHEREILQSLSHEHLVRLLFSMEQSGTVHMVTHLYPALTLQHALSPTPPIDLIKTHPGWLENSFCCLLSALRFLHSRNIKHGTLTPQKLIIDTASATPPNILISEFGASRRFTLTSLLDPQDATLWYTAPEQSLSQGRRAADVFSLALIFLEVFVYLRMRTPHQRSPHEVLCDAQAFGPLGAAKVGDERVKKLVDKLSEGAAEWLLELAAMLKGMLAYAPVERPLARQLHLKMVHVVVGGAAAELLHCSPKVQDADDDAGDSQGAGGVLEVFLRTMKMAPAENVPVSLVESAALERPLQTAAVNDTHMAETVASETPKKRTLEETEPCHTDDENAKKAKI